MDTMIKTILVPTDLTEKSLHVLDYATDLAKFSGAALVLFHAYHIPTVVTDITVVMPSVDEVEAGIREEMEALAHRCAMVLGGADRISIQLRQGFAPEEIPLLATELQADLIVMGVQGGGFLDEHVFGSVTVSVMRAAPCPVLSVPAFARFAEVKHIALACDFSELTENRRVMERFNAVATIFGAHVYVLHIAPEGYVPDASEAAQGLKIDSVLGSVPHTFHHFSHTDVIAGIHAFTEMYHVDMVAMIPHKRGFMDALFHGSHTRKMAFHSHLPLLILPF